uniref:Jacalin-type lectin domain-containing protein n=1 Tax=Aegilops tauschii subsp. strangulata TaxID=200361 RepID=A0A452XI39_AEGTS
NKPSHSCCPTHRCCFGWFDKATAKMSKPVKIGPWGGNSGSERDVQPKPTRMVSVTVSSGAIIDAIAFTYVGTDNAQHS